ncbi:MAG: GH92 family glycosyl hydrolase [Muribaculaceae bacterium]|nr:GH92 family glycosyl hydrolase [Muribaculaceae bacterium]
MKQFLFSALVSMTALCASAAPKVAPVDYVNPYMGNISHLLQPTLPTVHVPYGMMRVYPQRGSYVDTRINGLPVVIINHRENGCFNISATQSQQLHHVIGTDWDNETVKPYYYSVDIDGQRVKAEYAPSERSAIYRFTYRENGPGYIVVNSGDGDMTVNGNEITGFQKTWGGVTVYFCGQVDKAPVKSGTLQHGKITDSKTGRGPVAMQFAGNSKVNLRYAVSFISVEQARANLAAEITHFDLDKVAQAARKMWNDELGKIEVSAPARESDLKVFYTSLYRCYERPVCMSEGGRYFNPSDHKVYNDEGHKFYTDDWLWDTYRATHPLRVLIAPDREVDMITSLIRTADKDRNHWFPTFPSPTGDSRRMNCNHGVAVVADAWAKGLHGFDLEKAYDYTRRAIEEKTLMPWQGGKACGVDSFYHKNGYVPALAKDEKETDPGVNWFEKRQPIPVTLGTSYDQWCLSRIATALGRNDDANRYLKCSYNYRNLFNPETGFFHPKDKDGNFLPDIDYRFAGGLGARDYYDENNGWVYRWDVQHNPADLINLMGGRNKFCDNLDRTFSEWLGKSKFEFYSQLPDHTGNVGQFSMANEPSLHIPYLYTYAGRPWMTQKVIRDLVHEWFRDDLMGVPGDEDGGGMSAFVVFSMMGFYPVTPGMPAYTLGSPFFGEIKMKLAGGKVLRIVAQGCSEQAKYIQSATLNGKPMNQAWLSHDDIKNGGTLVLVMGERRNTAWASAPGQEPPSAMPCPAQ